MFYPRQRMFRSYWAWSPSLPEAALHAKTLTIRKDFSYERWSQNLTTPFHEVEVIPYSEAQREFLAKRGNWATHIPIAQNLHAFCSGYMAMLKQSIETAWNPDKIHVIATSSGFDSRCITMAIRELELELGPGWLGKVLFFEAAGESEPFTQMMEMQGWNKDQYISCYGGKPTEYHAYSFDFRKAYKRLNGFVSYPVNVWYTPIEWLQEQGILPNDDSQIQCFTMYGANETSRVNRHPHQGLDFYFWWHYHHMLSAFPLKGEWIHPSYHDSMMRYLQVNRAYLAQLTDAQSVCAIVAPFLFPEFNNIKKMCTPDVEIQGYLHPSPRIVEQTVRDYQTSWYGKNVHPDVKPAYEIEYRNWWGHWATASMCEYLISKGRRIDIA